MNWLVYFPGLKTRPALSHLQKLGIDRAWHGWDYDPNNLRGADGVTIHNGGPDRGAGYLCCLQSLEREYQIEFVYKPDRQIWKPCVQDGEITHWIGWYKDHDINPKCIERYSFDAIGYPVRLNDGNTWHIPVARGEDSVIPSVAGMDWSTGQWVDVPDAKLSGLTGIADAIYAWMCEGGEQPHKNTVRQWACDILQVNYSLTAFHVAAWGLLKGQEKQVCWCFIDFPKIAQEAQKRVEASKKKPRRATIREIISASGDGSGGIAESTANHTKTDSGPTNLLQADTDGSEKIVTTATPEERLARPEASL